ncbi:MAG: class I SAM-dependent methyltransferase [Bacteroidota bacterium]
MDKAKHQTYFDSNRSLWNEKTSVHLDSDFYQMPQFRAGEDLLKPAELEALGDVSGKRLLHLQCHFGQDTLAWARRGAHVTGVDLSDAAISAACELRDELGLEARFIRSNVYDIEQHLDEEFDIVISTYGTTVWLPDLNEWSRLVARYLKPGGVFFLAEFHPAFYMFEFENWRVVYSYFTGQEPYKDEMVGTYADRNADLRHDEYFWNHSIAQTLQPLLDRGLRLREFREYPYNYWNCFPNMVETAPGQFMIKGFEDLLPLMYSIFLEKPLG